jgi:hypothetical protein
MNADVAWRNGERLIKDIFDDSENIWAEISSVSEAEWESRRTEYGLHRYPAGHDRLWCIASRICRQYNGNASNIWWGKESSRVIEELWDLRAGEQISRMIVGALRDCGQVVGSSDVKADAYVCRVLGRAVLGAPIKPPAATELSRELNPEDPWQLDWPLWSIEKHYCSKNAPCCSQCYLERDCVFAQENRTN